MMYPTSKDQESPESIDTELALDRPEEISFIKAIEALGPTPEGSVRLFEREKGDWYSAHGSDAHYIAREVYRTTSVLKYLGAKSGQSGPTEGLASCTMNKNVANQFLREALTGKALRIEIYSNGGKKGAPWQVAKTASPGNLNEVEDMLFANSDIMEAPVLMAIKLHLADSIATCGIAFVDTSVRSMGVSEYVDNDLFSNTEALIIQLGVKEVLLSAEDKVTGYEAEKLRQVIDRCNVVITNRKKVEFQAKNIEQDLNRLLKEDQQAVTLPEFDLKQAMGATAAVISYLNLLGDTSNYGAYHLEHHDLSQFMRLDASALRALHLMPDPNGMGGSGSKNMSLYGLLNCCKTSQGSRLLNQWLKQPLVDLYAIKRRQDLVERFVEDHDLRSAMQDALRKMPDLHRLSKRFKKGVASLENVVRAYQAILELPTFIDALNNAVSDDERLRKLFVETYVKPMHELNEALKPYSDLVETTVDLDELDNHNYVIKPEYDEDLGVIRDRLKSVTRSLDEEHRHVAADLGFEPDNKNLHFEQNPIYGHCFRLTRKESAVLRGKKGFIELTNRNNGTFFTTNTLRQLSNDFKDLTQKYDRKQSSLVKEVISIAASYAEVFEPLNNHLAHLDVIISFAHVAHSMEKPYVKPTVHPKGTGDIKLIEARHACLEVQEEIQFIPNDAEMIRGEHELTILSGPNMCGKSTYIRQIGCIALLAQIGSFVPCTSAEIPVFDMILCRVGAGDSQLKGVSTFMAEMLETATILKSATRDSLVIVDELGRGTSTYDGFGLAWAISEHIATQIHCFCLFATHFHELASLANQVPTVKNLHVVAEVLDRPGSVTGKEVVLLYKVAPGACDKSFGIHVAELAHFPEEVIKHAKRKADELEDFGDETSTAPHLAPEVIAAGVDMVRKFCKEWSNRDSAIMDVDADVSAMNKERFKRLRACFDEARPALEANQWFQHIVASL